MRRVGGGILGGVLGAVLAGAATQLLFLLCVIGGPDAESCGMGVYLLVLPAFVLAGACLGVFVGFAVDSSDKISQLGRTLGGALLGGLSGFVILLAIAVLTGGPPESERFGMIMEISDALSTAALDSLHHAARVDELTNSAAFSIPAMTSFVGALCGWKNRKRLREPLAPADAGAIT